MTLAARLSLLHSDPNDFLFASVGDEQNGMPGRWPRAIKDQVFAPAA